MMPQLAGKLSTCPVLLLLLFFAAVVCAAAQRGGKAEPRRIQFRPGASSATYTDSVRSSHEAEYTLAARAGQRLVVRLISQPFRSASLKALGPNGSPLELKRERGGADTWTATLAETGDYFLAVYRPAGGAGATSYTLTVSIPPPASRKTTAADDLDAEMRKFIRALKDTDAELFLSLFSRERAFYANNPLNVTRVPVRYPKLAADVRNKKGYYWTYLARGDGGTYDAFVDNITTTGARMWKRVEDNRYVPPDGEDSSDTYVQWGREGGRWVIVEISYPQA